MKNLLLIFSFSVGIMVLPICCSKQCECYTNAQPFRIAILNSKNENLLDPKNSNKLNIDKLTNDVGVKIKFEIKDYIIPSNPSGFFHLESIDKSYFNKAIGHDGAFYIYYENSSKIDTINVLIEEEHSKQDGCKCTSFPYRYMKYNGNLITEYDWTNRTGSAIIRK